MMVVPDSDSEAEMPSTEYCEAGDTMLALVLDESNLTLGADVKNTSVEPTVAYQMDKELGEFILRLYCTGSMYAAIVLIVI